MKIRYVLDIFIKIHIITATLYSLGVNGCWDKMTWHPIFLGILSIIWIMFPLIDWYNEQIEEEQKQK